MQANDRSKYRKIGAGNRRSCIVYKEWGIHIGGAVGSPRKNMCIKSRARKPCFFHLEYIKMIQNT